ncbi:MAG: hypothetical protein ACTSYL_12035 [Candidatus Thorarchaeota archaeon]
MTRWHRSTGSVFARVSDLADCCYPELAEWSVSIHAGRIRAIGDATWSTESKSLRIRINNDVTRWPDPAVIGLLAHELSHPIVGAIKQAEYRTDCDVLERGLAVYLAFERAYIGRYHDDRLNHNDRYLGYLSIREKLSIDEMKWLDDLLGDFGLIPSKRPRIYEIHDVVTKVND